MYWFLHVDIFLLLKLILISLYIDFKILTFLYYLPLYLFHNVLIFYALTFLYYLHWYFFHHVMICSHWYFYITYIYTYFNRYWFLLSDIFILFTLILISSYISFYTLTFLCNLHLYLLHYVFIFTQWHFYITYNYNYFLMYWF